MKIRAGYSIAYDCPQPTPMILMLSIHPSRRIDLLSEHAMSFDQPVEPRDYSDGFGNTCTRIVVPAGRTTINCGFTIYDHGRPDVVAPDAVQQGDGGGAGGGVEQCGHRDLIGGAGRAGRRSTIAVGALRSPGRRGLIPMW